MVNGVSWTGVDQTGGATSFPHGTGATGSSTTSSVTVTSATGNAVMAVHGLNTTVNAVNNTQTFLDNVPSTESAAGNRTADAAGREWNAAPFQQQCGRLASGEQCFAVSF